MRNDIQEQPENGQAGQHQRRRPLAADALQRPTAGCRPSSCSAPGAADAGPAGFAKLTPTTRSRPPGRRRTATCETATWNGSQNGSTAQPTDRGGGERRRLRTGWELPKLVRPLPVRRKRERRRKRRLPRYAAAIVEYVYQCRFVVASQVLRRFPRWIRAARTVQQQLAALVDAGHLATAPVRSTSPNFPFVYYTTRRGVRLVNETYARLGSARRYPPGEGCKRHGLALQGILHEVLTSEFELAVRRTVEARADLKLLQTERRYFRRERRLRYSDLGKTQSVVPDAGFLLAQEEGRDETSHNISRRGMQYFVEFDAGSMPAPRFGEKLRRYGRWADSDAGQRHLHDIYGQFGLRVPQAGFRLLVVVHDKLHAGGDEKRLAELFTQGLTLPAAMRDRLWFATAADLQAHEADSPPLDAKIWYRGRAAKGWLPAFRSLPEENTNTRRRRYVVQHLPTLPRNALFPSPAGEAAAALPAGQGKVRPPDLGL